MQATRQGARSERLWASRKQQMLDRAGTKTRRKRQPRAPKRRKRKSVRMKTAHGKNESIGRRKRRGSKGVTTRRGNGTGEEAVGLEDWSDLICKALNSYECTVAGQSINIGGGNRQKRRGMKKRQGVMRSTNRDEEDI